MRGHAIDADRLRNLYVDESLSPRAIGKRLGLSDTAVRRHLKALGVSLRSRSAAQQARVAGLSYAALRQLYLDERLSQPQIAARLRCSVDSVRAAMKRWQLSVRSPSDSAQLARGVNLSEAELRRLYLVEGAGTRTIAMHFGCGETTVRRRLQQYGILARNPGAVHEIVIGAPGLFELYVEEGLTLEAIAERFRCSPATVSRQLKRFNIPARPSSSPVYPRADFSGDPVEKSYLTGFRLGDLAVLEEGRSIIISTSTTKLDQINLLQSLFADYGHTYVYQHRSGRQYFHCGLNASFKFLVAKTDAVPTWVTCSVEYLAAFMAGYIDAEGSFQTAPRLSIRSYDENILRAFWGHWSSWGIQCPGPRVVTTAGYTNKARVVSRRDVWDLTVRRRRSLELLIARLLPLMKHSKRQADARRVLDVLENRKKSRANR